MDGQYGLISLAKELWLTQRKVVHVVANSSVLISSFFATRALRVRYACATRANQMKTPAVVFEGATSALLIFPFLVPLLTNENH